MMATIPLSSSSLLPLLECLEDSAAGASEQTDAYLTIANRLSGENGRQFFPIVIKHFSRLGKALQTHISSENEELSQAALQALGFCVFNANIVSGIPAIFAEEILSALCELVLKSSDKNTCTRALWVISKQNFPAEVVSKKTSEILKTLDAMQTKDIQSILMDHESLNVIIKLLEQAPSQMGEGAVCWAKLVIPLVVHSASKVRLRAAAALEMGMPLLLEKQQEVAAIVEPMMSSKLIPEMQKLFSTKNESNVLKLWPLFVRLLGKLLHKGGAFINSLLYLEELGFRSSSPTIKKIAFIAWKSLIDNFALNPDILCSSKRLKLLMQPLSSILVRTEALLLTKLEVWWYLVVKLGPSLAANFDQVGIPLLHSTLPTDVSLQSPTTPSRGASQSNGIGLVTPKSGVPSCSSSGSTPRINLNSSVSAQQSYSSIQLLGLEMLLHYFHGPEATAVAAKNKLQLSLEPLTHSILSSPSFFSKHATSLISAIRDGFIAVGKDAPEALLSLIWNSLVNHVSTTVEAAGNKKERQGSEVLTLLLQALQAIVSSNELPAPRVLVLLEATVKGIPQKVLGSAAYQVANMDVINGTPALYLILLFYNNSLLPSIVTDERFFLSLETLVSCGLSGPTSPLAFVEAVLGTVSRSVEVVENREHLWRMWSVVVNPLTDTITQTNEVNQGDALEHNFSAIHLALMFPISHLLPDSGLPQMTQKSMLSTWARLYKAFARCSALVATAEENVCCEELCARISAALDNQALKCLSALDAIASMLHSIVENVDFSPFTPQFQQKMKSPHTPLGWVRKRSKALGNLSGFHGLLVRSLEAFLALIPSEENSALLNSIGSMLISIVSTIFTNFALSTVIQESLASISKPLACLYGQVTSSDSQQAKSHSVLESKLEKMAGEMLGCLQSRSALQFDDELLAALSPLLCELFPHKSKQIRSVVTQFWNATFGNAVVLVYPEMLKPVLNQAKQKAPLILPGFQSIENSEDFSGPCSSECSQLDTKISGIKMTSVGKRESLLARAAELKERSTGTTSKPVSVKLDFGSPKPPRRDVLEEEASVDFVFIPPETKERVLTEHQKEVKRTKRVDIPAMYNNLDASLDTTVFTQYTQSQEESMEKFPADKEAETKEETTPENKDSENGQSPGGDVTDAQEVTNLETAASEKVANEQIKTAEKPSAAMPVGDDSGHELSTKEDLSPNVSSSSDVISGTPPKSSRRQSFITLEKYSEGRPASPMNISQFTGRVTGASHSQDSPKSQCSTPGDSSFSQPEPGKGSSQASAASNSQLSTQQNKKKRVELKPAPQCVSEGTEDEEEIIPDTQSQIVNVAVDASNKPEDKSIEEMETDTASLEDSSRDLDSSSSQVEPRRSGRRRSRPVRPGDDFGEADSKKNQKKAPEEVSTDTEKTLPSEQMDVLSGRTRRSKVLDANKNENSKLQSNDSKEQQSQINSQASSVAAAAGASRSRSSRNKMKEAGQTVISVDKQSPSSQEEEESALSQSESSSHSRTLRRADVLSSGAEGAGKRQRDEESQSDYQSALDKNTNTAALGSDSVANSQSPGRPKRKRRSEITDSQKDQPENECVKDLSQPDSQTLSPVKGRQSRRKKAEEETNSLRDSPSSASVSSQGSQPDISEVKEPNQGRVKYNTRRASQSSLISESLGSDASDNKEEPRARRAGGRKSQVSEVVQDTVMPENVPQSISAKEDASVPSVPIDASAKDPEATLDIVHEAKDHKAEDKEELPTADEPAVDHCVSDVESAKEEPPSDKESAKQTESFREEMVAATVEEKAVEGATIVSSQKSLVLPEKVELKTPELHRCPHTKRGRGRRRSASCKCFLGSHSTPSQESVCIDSQTLQDLKKEEPVEPENFPSDSELNIKPVLTEKAETLPDDCSVVTSEQSPEALPTSTDAEMPSQSPEHKISKSDFQSQDEEDCPAQVEEVQKEDDGEITCQEMQQESSTADNSCDQLQNVSPQEDSHSNSQCVEDKTVCQEESDPPMNQEAVLNMPVNKDEEEMQEVDGIAITSDCGTAQPEQTELDHVQHLQEDVGEETPLEKDLQTETVQPNEASEPPQTASAETYLESPPKKKPSDSCGGDLDVGQSPSSSATRGVWSPSASPSTSILKKGQKRPYEEDSPSPLLKSRRVSFANPIYQQELADDIDRRSPVIRTSSPRTKNIGQPKYVTTPTKGLLTLSPRKLRSPGFKSSKKCLISEMSQEPRPIPKDCVFPALVSCSTPVEAVLPQISSNMWPRGFGQLVRARNIKTVGDLSALTPSDIKLLPIRSPKLSNVRKALRTYYEQQRKGRPDDLQGFDETEKMTSEEMDVPLNTEEEQTSEEVQAEVAASELPPALEQKQEEPESVELLSDVVALGARLTPEELSRWSPKELGLMHEYLGGMMRSIVDNLQSRLINNLEDSLP